MKEIPVSRGMVALVDDEDFDLVGHLRWYASIVNKGSCFYAARHTSRKSEKHMVIYMHRIILNAPSGMDVDHINGNGLDNQKKNLRLCNHQQNMCNIRKRKGASSLYKGVHWAKIHQRWVAKIEVNKKIRAVGVFRTEIEAALAYNEAAKELHGEYAVLNNIQEAMP